MQQCSHCQYFVPAGYLNCPQCSMPLAAGTPAPAHSVYSDKSTARKNPVGLVVGIGLALVAVVAVTLVAKGGGNETPVDTTLVAPAADGWRTFTPPDRAFAVSFPGTPDRNENVIGSLNEKAQQYSMKQDDFEFGVVVSGAPAYFAPHEAGRKLEEIMRPIYEGQGAAIEAAAQVLTPRGDQAFDIVFVLGETRTWSRFTTWGGNLIRVYASLPAAKQPNGTQSATYSRLRDSVRQ